MGSDSQLRGRVSVAAVVPDRFTAPEHDQCPVHTALIPAQLGRVGAPSGPPRPPPAPSTQENFLALIGELSLRVVRSPTTDR